MLLLMLRKLRTIQAIGATQLGMLERSVDDQLEFVQIHRFGQIVCSTRSNQPYRALDRAVAGQHDNRVAGSDAGQHR
ncbi:hypothetical protein RZS08_45580, partial [Arthrospira platensis SPKY1]|nr:hypothetical protein [Arthrospira platensis SPKY1]